MVPDEVSELLEDAVRSARGVVHGLTPGDALVEVALHFVWTWKWEIERLETSLCAVHHLRGVHGGSVRIAGTAPGGLEFTPGDREVDRARH